MKAEHYQSALERLRDLGMHGMAISRDGKTISEVSVAPYRLDRPHTLFSVTKSITSIAVGFAVQDGLLSLDDRVAAFFPDIPHSGGYMEQINIRNLLMMATGHTKEPYFWPLEREPLTSFLRSKVQAPPGSAFLYNTAGTHMLAYILEKAAQQSMEDYLCTRLFDPLGIEGWMWERHPDGACKSGVGLHMKTRDILKLGNFLLFEGFHEGKQLLSKAWIKEATKAQIFQPGDPNGEWTSGYGYQFWINRREDSYRADGAFGQLVIVIPKRRLVIAVNSGSGDVGAMLDVIFEKLLPLLDGEVAAQVELTTPPPVGNPVFPAYRFAENRLGLERIAFETPESVTFTRWGKQFRCAVGYGEWRETVLENGPVACAAGSDGSTALLRVLHTQTPFTDDLRFIHDGVTVTRNVGFDDNLCQTLRGTAEEDVGGV